MPPTYSLHRQGFAYPPFLYEPQELVPKRTSHHNSRHTKSLCNKRNAATRLRKQKSPVENPNTGFSLRPPCHLLVSSTLNHLIQATIFSLEQAIVNPNIRISHNLPQAHSVLAFIFRTIAITIFNCI